MHIYDSSNNHVGPDENGDIENNIDGVIYEVIEGSKFAFLPDGTEYVVKGGATDTGTFDVFIQEVVDEEVTKTTIFKDVPLTASTQVNFDLGANIPSQIYLDNDNDGNFESNQSVSSTSAGFIGLMTSSESKEINESIPIGEAISNSRARSERAPLARIESVGAADASVAIAYADIQRQLVEISVILDEMAAREVEVSIAEDNGLGQEEEILSTTTVAVEKNNNPNTAAVYKSVGQKLKGVFKSAWSWLKSKL